MLLFRIFLLVCFLGLGSQCPGSDVPGTIEESCATIQSTPGSERAPVFCDEPLLQHLVSSLKNISGPQAVAHNEHRSTGGWVPFDHIAVYLRHQCAVSSLRLIKSRLLEHFIFPQVAFLYPRHSFW